MVEKANSVHPALNTVQGILWSRINNICNVLKFQLWNESKKQKGSFRQSYALGLNMQVQVSNVEREVGHVLRRVFWSVRHLQQNASRLLKMNHCC